MKLEKFISAEERKSIEKAVREAERRTVGEIVPVMVESSSHYGWLGYHGALLGWASAVALSIALHVARPFFLGFWENLGLQLLGLVIGWAFSRFSFGLRLLAHERVLAEEVSQAAQRSFLKNGLRNTRDRTGVLLFVSLRERRVQILADSGIHEKVGDAFWSAEVARVVSGIRAGRPAEGMIEAIRSIGDKLADHFPRKEDDSNELPDQLRTE
jgi:putative membrane protein